MPTLSRLVYKPPKSYNEITTKQNKFIGGLLYMSIDPNILIEGAKLFPAPIKSFNNIWDITIGNKLEAWNQKSIIKNSLDVKFFKESIENKVSQNPPEKFQEPNLSIIGPALEASKFYIEEKEIRNLFANLIAASMNSDFNSTIHHSFVEIIKQLSPKDCIFFKELSNESPILNHLDPFNNSFIQKNMFRNDHFQYFPENSLIIDNLKRLGLVDILFDIKLNNSKDFSVYNIFKDASHIKKGILYITDLGLAFKKVCCEDL